MPLRSASSRIKKTARNGRRLLGCEKLEDRLALAVVISEFLADNQDGVDDAAGHLHDWIELKNTGAAVEDVSGWYLSDDALDLTKWQVPSTAATTSLAPGEALLVFASGAGGEIGAVGDELHANFQLSQEPGYLGLARADGVTIADEYSLYPQQTSDVSYGVGFDVAGFDTSTQTLVGDASPVTVTSPVGPDAARDDHWREIGFDDSGWLTGTGSVGFDRNGDAPDLSPYIGRELTLSEMNSYAATPQHSAYVRYEFDVADKEQLTSLGLGLRFDDGFIAYLNGREVARANFAEDFVYPQPQWNSYAGHQQGTSSSSGNWNRGEEADQVVSFDLTAYLPFLEDEGNVLAFHGVNSRSSGGGGTNRLDFLIDAELTAERASGATRLGFLPAPSPGRNNGVAYEGFIEDTNFSVDRGVYDTAQTVALTATEPDAIIRYTTDFSEPTLSNGSTYAAPLSISTTTVVRAKAFKTNYIPTNVDTQTYIIAPHVIGQDASYVDQPYQTWGHDKEDDDNVSGYNLDDESDWEMDPQIVSGNESALTDALTGIPSISIVTDWDNLWSGEPLPGTGQDDGRVAYEPQGIYIHGRSSERPNSFEYFTADGGVGVQADAVIEIQGHSSPGRWKSDKLSLQVKFKSPYGDPKLNLDMFAGTAGGDDAVDQFDTMILDAGYNYTWTHANVNVQTDYARFVPDQVTADLQNLASGAGGFHGRWVHLYLDGLYWGIYNVHERPDEHYASEYYGGGGDEDYYVVKHSTNDIDGLPYTWVKGGLAAEAAYDGLLSATRQDMSSAANYQAVEDILDVEQFIDYMIVHMYAGNESDWPHNNWYATFDPTAADGKWRFHAWDQEHAFPTNDNGDSFDQFVDLTDEDDPQTAGEILANLIQNDEFRLRFSDRVQELMRNGGVLTPDEAEAVYQARVNEITEAILAESARWGDNRDADDPYTQADFLNVAGGVLSDFFPTRTATVLGQFDSGGNDWLVDDLAPAWSQYGGEIGAGFMLTMSNPNPAGTIYYTTDGSDPRDRATGGPSASAVAYSGAIPLSESTRVRARVLADSPGAANDWSAEVNRAFRVDEPLPVRIVELMYNPATPGDLEYIELLNTGSEPVDLAGMRIADFSGEGYTFSDHVLAPGERIVVPENVAAFQAHYPDVTNVTSTAYSGSLSNGGETVTLLDAFGRTLQSFTYSDEAPWPGEPDGDGRSLEYVGPYDADAPDPTHTAGDPYDDSGNWRASLAAGGSPGASGALPGDYDNNGAVEAADYFVWRDAFGSSDLRADGNGDGLVSAIDYNLWRDNLGAAAPTASVAQPIDDSLALAAVAPTGGEAEESAVTQPTSDQQAYAAVVAAQASTEDWPLAEDLRAHYQPLGAAQDNLLLLLALDRAAPSTDLPSGEAITRDHAAEAEEEAFAKLAAEGEVGRAALGVAWRNA